MGGRTPTTLRPRRGALKCEFCGRSVSSIQALESHQKTLHAVALRRKEKYQGIKKPLTYKPKQKVISGAASKVLKTVIVSKQAIKKSAPVHNGVRNVLKKADSGSKVNNTVSKLKKRAVIKNIRTLDPVKSSPEATTSDRKTESPDLEMNAQHSTMSEKTEFRCPKCRKVFSMCFSAQKHIQKYHCVDMKGTPVDPESPDLIQPVRVEYCTECNAKYCGIHDCPHALKPIVDLPNLGPFGCVACGKTFDKLINFQQHISSLHNDGLESLLFPTIEEFEIWRRQMETQTKTLYAPVGKLNNKEFYQCCSTLSNFNDVTGALSCPSVIILKSYPSGIQVHFYKTHHDHESKPYHMIKDQYKSYSISDIIHGETDDKLIKNNEEIKQETESEEETTPENDDEKDTRVTFKEIMEDIIKDTEKINEGALEILLDKARKMKTILHNIIRDVEFIPNKSSKSSPNKKTKRKSENMSITSPLRKKNKKDSTVNNINDSTVNNINDSTVNNINDSTFKSPVLPIKKPNTFSLADDKDSIKILEELDVKNTSVKTANGSPKKMVTFPKFDCSPSAFHDHFTNFVSNIVPGMSRDKLTKKDKNKKPKTSPKFKTKIGQYNPNSPKKTDSNPSSPKINVKELKSPKRTTKELSPKRKTKVITTPKRTIKEITSPKRTTKACNRSEVEPKPLPKRPHSKKRARDFKYEIKERENDCNILILKL